MGFERFRDNLQWEISLRVDWEQLSSWAIYLSMAGVKLFIGGLSWGTTSESLKSAFDRFGDIIEAKVILDKATDRSRGFGFVTFSDTEAADEALEQMNGKDLDGRQIRVDHASSSDSSSGGGSRRFGGDRDDDDNYRGRGGRSSGRGGRGGDRDSRDSRDSYRRNEGGSGGGFRGGDREDRYGGSGGRGGKFRDNGGRRSGPYERSSGGGGYGGSSRRDFGSSGGDKPW